MLILGHLGFSLAAGKTAEAAYERVSRRRIPGSGLFDYRVLAVGAMLPDLIDKPLFWLPLPEILDVSRLLGHSLLLPLLLMVLWWAGPARLQRISLTLAVGSLMHLVLDGVLATPQTLVWPLLGWEFNQSGPGDLFTSLPIPWELPWNLNWLVVSELLGAAMCGVLALQWRWERRGRSSGYGRVRHVPTGLPVAARSTQGR